MNVQNRDGKLSELLFLCWGLFFKDSNGFSLDLTDALVSGFLLLMLLFDVVGVDISLSSLLWMDGWMEYGI